MTAVRTPGSLAIGLMSPDCPTGVGQKMVDCTPRAEGQCEHGDDTYIICEGLSYIYILFPVYLTFLGEAYIISYMFMEERKKKNTI